jgi:hypothetical protein
MLYQVNLEFVAYLFLDFFFFFDIFATVTYPHVFIDILDHPLHILICITSYKRPGNVNCKNHHIGWFVLKKEKNLEY